MRTELLEAIDGAHYVFRGQAAASVVASEYNYRREGVSTVRLLFVWHGGTIINIYSQHSGECIHCFTLSGEVTRDKVHDSIVDHLAELQLPED